MFKHGDKVKVVRKGEEDSCWIPDMNTTVGLYGIVDFGDSIDCWVDLEEGTGWYYPQESLELIVDNGLTQSDFQCLEEELCATINMYSDMVKANKNSANRYWQLSDKNNENTKNSFTLFSIYNKEQKYYQSKLNKLSAIQAKIKRLKAI